MTRPNRKLMIGIGAFLAIGIVGFTINRLDSEAVAIAEAPGNMKIETIGARVPATAVRPDATLAEVFGREITPVRVPLGASRFGIVAGVPAEIVDYPGRVKIEVTSWNDDYDAPQIEHCAGDLIALDRVDTAGHCGSEGWYRMRVFWGDASRNAARVVEVRSFIQHAGYSGAGDPRDLGVLMLSDPLPEGTPLRRYASDAEVLRLVGQPIPIASWGLTGPPQDGRSIIPDRLLETRIRLVSVDDVLVEAEAINGSGDCQGGSGTGLGSAVTLGRFSGVYPSPSGATCDHPDFRMSFVAPGYAKRWGDAVAAAWREGRD